MELKFIWDAEKNRENIRKHDVSFEEAITIFDNYPFEVFYDPDHSEREDRYIAVGLSTLGRILIVVHSENRRGTEMRVISARKATKKEQKTLFRR